jgi:hypothetical protein
MFHIFNFGQLVVASDKIFAGQTKAVRTVNVPVTMLRDTKADETLKKWMQRARKLEAQEYLGADFRS